MSAEPACVGRHDLFDATDIQTHREAAAICATCPIFIACQKHTAQIRKEAGSIGIEGTWAGALYGVRKQRWSGRAHPARDRTLVGLAWENGSGPAPALTGGLRASTPTTYATGSGSRG